MSSQNVRPRQRRAGRPTPRSFAVRMPAPGSAKMLGLNSRLVRGRSDPPAVRSDIQVQQNFPFSLAIPAETTEPIVVTPASIAAALPSCVDRFRIQKISAWAKQTVGNTDSSNHGIDSVLDITITDDLANFSDQGTYGQSRAQLHIIPCLALRQRWLTAADSTTSLFTVVSNPNVSTENEEVYFVLLLDVRTTTNY